MLAQLGPLISNAAGSVGGLTIQRGPAGYSVRPRSLPTRRRTTYTQPQRLPFTQLAEAWRNLTPSKRDGWAALAAVMPWYNRFGEPIAGNALWAFMRCNRYRLLIGQKVLTTAPAYSTPAIVEGLTLATNWGAGSAVLTWSSGAVPADTVWLIGSTPVLSPGTTTPRGRARQITMLSTGDTSGRNLYAAITARQPSAFGVGGWILVNVQPVTRSTGIPGAYHEASNQVA